MHSASGVHLLADLHGVDAALLADGARIDALLREAALAAGATVLHSHFHSFGDQLGVTGVVMLAESHISIHTWPESGFAAVDIFMCGAAQPARALEVIEAATRPAHNHARIVARGQRQL